MRPGRAGTVRAATLAEAPLTFRSRPWAAELDTAGPGSRRVVAGTVELAGRSLALVGASS